MPNRVRILTVPDSDRAELERRARSKGAPARVVERARIVLLAAQKNAPTGWVLRSAAQAAGIATRFLEAYA